MGRLSVCLQVMRGLRTLVDPIRTPHEDRSASAYMPNPGVVPEKLISDVLLYWPGDEDAMRELRRRVYVNTMMIAPRALGRGHARPRGGGGCQGSKN